MARITPATTTHSSPVQAFQDHPVFIHLVAELDPPALHHVLVAHHPHEGPQLVVADGGFRHQQGPFFLGDGHPHPGEQPRQDDPVLDWG